MKLLFPLHVEPGRAIVDARGNLIASVHARRVYGTLYEGPNEDAVQPADADENAREIARLLNAAHAAGFTGEE